MYHQGGSFLWRILWVTVGLITSIKKIEMWSESLARIHVFKGVCVLYYNVFKCFNLISGQSFGWVGPKIRWYCAKEKNADASGDVNTCLPTREASPRSLTEIQCLMPIKMAVTLILIADINSFESRQKFLWYMYLFIDLFDSKFISDRGSAVQHVPQSDQRSSSML